MGIEKSVASPPFLAYKAAATCGERRRYTLKFLKAIMIVAVLAGGLSLGACSQHKEAVQTSTTASSTHGYSK